MIRNSRIIPARFSVARCEADNFFPFEIFKRSGNNEVVAKGQMFLQSPVAITSNAGARGMSTFQKSTRPKFGFMNMHSHRAIPMNQNKI
jgi:hypothetical protein